MHTRLVLLFALALSVTGLSTEPDAAYYAGGCTVRRDDFKKITSINGPQVGREGEDGSEIAKFSLSAERKDGEAMRYFVIFRTYRIRDWAQWSTVTDEYGKEFELDEVVSRVSKDASLDEIVSCVVTREYLDSVKTGVKWRMYGKTETADIFLSPKMIVGFLQRCDALK